MRAVHALHAGCKPRTMKRTMRLTSSLLSSGLAVCLWACLFPTSSSDEPYYAGSPCSSDSECGTGTSPCRAFHCENRTCVQRDVPEGVTARSNSTAPSCKRIACDGKGNEITVPDATNLPEERAPVCRAYTCSPAGEATLVINNDPNRSDTGHDCKRTVCDVAGNPSSTPDLNDLPNDIARDCKRPACSADGQETTAPDPSDIPADREGDCRQPACDRSGRPTTVIDDSDPPSATCKSYTCRNGTATGVPANLGTNCSTGNGLVCGATGECDACPAPDAACTDPGPGRASRSPGTAYDWGDIGHCDSGGRTFCGALKTGETAYFAFRDDGTGIFCEFDPAIRVTPTSAVTLCEYFSCAEGVTCPAGSTPSTNGTNSGCCITTTSSGGSMRIQPKCRGARVLMSVTSTAGCAGYKLSFNL